MLTYIKHSIRKITEEDRWNDLIENMFLLLFFQGLTAWMWLSYINYIPEEGPKYPPPCHRQYIGNRVLVNYKTCCNMFNVECMTYEEFWEVFDSCKPKGGGFVWDGFIGIGTTPTSPTPTPGIQLF